MSERDIKNISVELSSINQKQTELNTLLTNQWGNNAYPNTVSGSNNSSTLITNGSNFTGEWEDVSFYNSITVAVKTDQDGYFEVQFSPDGVNQDSTLTRYYRATQIEPPHRFTITRKYFRVVFYNNSGSDQTYFRLQTLVGEKSELNIPIDQTISQDYDAIATRPSDYDTEVALGLRQGTSTWNKFFYNLDVDTASPELLASWGGSFDPLTNIIHTAQTFTITYTNTTDGVGQTGALSLLIYYIDANSEQAVAVHTLGSTGSDVTSFTGFGINRCLVYSNGGVPYARSEINITATTDTTTQAQIPANSSVTQQSLFFTPINHTGLVWGGFFSINKLSGGGTPRVTIVGYSYSKVTGTRYEFFRHTIDTSVENTVLLRESKKPLIFSGREVIYFIASTTVDNTVITGRYSLDEIRKKDA